MPVDICVKRTPECLWSDFKDEQYWVNAKRVAEESIREEASDIEFD